MSKLCVSAGNECQRESQVGKRCQGRLASEMTLEQVPEGGDMLASGDRVSGRGSNTAKALGQESEWEGRSVGEVRQGGDRLS
jgi:hypothetical protein